MARLNVLTLETASLYMFRRSSNRTTSQLSLRPNELTCVGRLLYKWALPLLKEYRHAVEEALGQSLDMPPHNFETTRNDVLWESAVPLSKLYSPLVLVNDTFVLQEFFVPHSKFAAWIREARPIYKDIDAYQRLGCSEGDVPAQSLILLNTTIRYVDQDATAFLSYSPMPGGMYAFVLYYRIKRLKRVERDLGVFHNRLAELAVRLGGTFYLPYRKCYSPDLLQRAYPRIAEFAALKEKYDPIGLFSNDWFDQYVLPLCSDSYQSQWRTVVDSGQPTKTRETLKRSNVVCNKEEFMSWLPRQDDPFLERRTDSYRAQLRDKHFRKKFSEEFLVNIFNIADPSEVVRVMSKAAWDPRNANDVAIFGVLRDHFQMSSGPIAGLKQGWRSVQQLSHQKTELTRETAAILYRLGLFGRVRGYLSVGDHGKTVNSFQAAGLLEQSSETRIFVAHDFRPGTDELSMNVVLERGSLDPVGDSRIQFDYVHDDAAERFGIVPTGSIDLVTLNQGLHHFPPIKLYDFLIEVRRVLREGGLFIFREHDLRLETGIGASTTSAPVAMLDLAHSIFNAVTGASVNEEASEIRAFRPLLEWRSLMEKLGFVDSLQCGLEQGDCTCDFMLCFVKDEPIRIGRSHPHPPTVTSDKIKSVTIEPPVMATIRTLLAQFPSSVVNAAVCIISKWLEKLPLIKDGISKFLLSSLPEALRTEEARRTMNPSLVSLEMLSPLLTVLAEFFVGKLDKLIDYGIHAEALIGDIHVRETANVAGLLSTPELWLILPVLNRRLKVMPESIGEPEKTALRFVETYFPVLLQTGDSDTCDTPGGERDTVQLDDLVLSNKNVDNLSVNKEEVLEALLTLGNAIPGLMDSSVVLADSGLTLSQQSALVGVLAAPDLPGFAENIAWYHDQRSWQELRSALVGDPSSVLQSKDLPTADRLFSKELDHSWHRALKAFLKGPRVQLKAQTLFGLRILKLGALISLYDEAKHEAADELRQARRHGSDLASSLPFEDSRAFHLQTERILSCAQKKEVTIQFNGEDNYDIFDVGFVVSAQFGYKSITSRLTDVTKDVRSFHADVHRQVAAKRAQKIERSLSSMESRNGASAPVGWLPIRENLLVDFRNKGGAVKLGDSMRKVVVSTGSLGLAGGNMLKLTYIPLQMTAADEAVDQLCDFVRSKRMIRADWHKNDGHYTWFKLSEWMQVEIMDLLVKSLDHTPWYQFPFLEFVSTYFSVLFQECRIVATEHGLADAYGSMAFATDFIPGVVMSFIFMQLQLLAFPLKMSLPSYDPESMVEEILMTAPLPTGVDPLQFFRDTVDERISDASILCIPRDCQLGLYRIDVPPFKAMGEIIVKIGEYMPSAMLLQISNQKIVQTLLSVEFEEPSSSSASRAYLQNLVTAIDSQDGLQVVLQYQYPMEVHSLRQTGELQARLVHLAVKAQVPSLLNLVRLVARSDRVKVKQIYDFWSG